jgi:hypothetical protein
MKTETRIYIALVVLALMGGGLWLARKDKAAEQSQHSLTAASADLPSLSVPKDDVEKITKIEITSPNKDEKGKKNSVTLEKKGENWEVTAPVSAKANASNVRTLLDSFKELKAKEPIDRGSGSYEQYELTDDKGVHAVAWKGADKAVDVYFGKSGSRGQMARIGGKDGVYIVTGYSGFVYTREVKNWRETSILKFEDANAIQVEITNKSGLYSFSKNGEKWAGSYAKWEKDGKLGKPEKEWKNFSEDKVKDMLRAFKALNAEDFGDEKADTGLDKAEENGGVVHIKLKDNAGDLVVKVGKVSKGTSRYAIKDGGDGTIYVVSSWASDWATATPSKFEKVEDKKKDGGAPEAPPPHMDEMPEE